MSNNRAWNWVIVVIGLWQALAAFVLGYNDVTAAVWNGLIVGLILAGVAFWATRAARDSTIRNLSWVNILLGLWLFVAPFALTYSTTSAALVNDWIVGAIAVIAAGIVAYSTRDGDEALKTSSDSQQQSGRA